MGQWPLLLARLPLKLHGHLLTDLLGRASVT
eukprot:SAG11_NODE_1837_length_4187_cov_4.303082_4_plen_31_part_00